MNASNNFIPVRILTIAAVIFFSVFPPLSGWSRELDNTAKKLTDEEKIQIIKEAVLKQFDKCPDQIDPELIRKELSRQIVINPAVDDFAKEMDRKKKAQINAKFPLTRKQLEEKCQKEAQEKYPFYKPGDEVKIWYYLHGKPFQASGIYYRKTDSHLLIGSSKIPLSSLSQEDSCRFDWIRTSALREKYINDFIGKYNRQRAEYARQLMDDKYQKSLGKLFFSGPWMTPGEFVTNRTAYLNEIIKIEKMVEQTEKIKSYSQRVDMLNQVIKFIDRNKWDHPEWKTVIEDLISNDKKKDIEYFMYLALKKKTPDEAAIILESAINKYPDAINISEAKALLQTIRSAQESKKQELWNRIMVNEGKFPSSQGRSYKRYIKDENYENYENYEDGNIVHKTKPVKIRIKDEN